MYFSRREVNVAAAFEKTSFFSKFKHPICEKTENKKLYPKEWSKKHIFHSYLFIFLRKPKRLMKWYGTRNYGQKSESLIKKGFFLFLIT